MWVRYSIYCYRIIFTVNCNLYKHGNYLIELYSYNQGSMLLTMVRLHYHQDNMQLNQLGSTKYTIVPLTNSLTSTPSRKLSVRFDCT